MKKTTLLAAVAAMGFGIAPAFAADMQNSGYTYPDSWGATAVQQVPAAKARAQAQGSSIGTYATQSGQGTWLFPPDANQGANS